MGTKAPARLIVLRHSKSAWPAGVADQDRPLAGRGRRDAPAAGRWLYETGCVPDLVVCSPARRTRQTWQLAAAELGGSVPVVVFEPRVYDASTAELLAVVRETSEERRTVLLVGHQPGVQELVLSLTGDTQGDALVRLREKFPTSAIAVLTLSAPWAKAAPGVAVLTDFTVPRGPKP